MKQLVIEHTDISVSRLAFGTAALHHLFSSRQRQKLLEAAASAGFTHFDTSPYYGYGLAEIDLGVFLGAQRAAFTVATKVGLYSWGESSNSSVSVWARKAVGKIFPAISLPIVNWQVARARSSLHASLKRLRTDYVDFLFLHEPEPDLTNSDEFLRWIEAECARGTVRSWGLAGVADRVAPWVRAGHPLARVVQTKDSTDKLEADFMRSNGRELQFTYGYLAHAQASQVSACELLLANALQRNPRGAIIVSTRRADRIGQLARAAL